MNPLAHIGDQGTVKTIDLTRRTSTEKVEDCPELSVKEVGASFGQVYRAKRKLL